MNNETTRADDKKGRKHNKWAWRSREHTVRIIELAGSAKQADRHGYGKTRMQCSRSKSKLVESMVSGSQLDCLTQTSINE